MCIRPSIPPGSLGLGERAGNCRLEEAVAFLCLQRGMEHYQISRLPALCQTVSKALIADMSAKLEAVIKTEIGIDDGREMPRVEGVDWAIDRIDL